MISHTSEKDAKIKFSEVISFSKRVMTSQMLDGYMKKLLLEIKRHKRKKLKKTTTRSIEKLFMGNQEFATLTSLKKLCSVIREESKQIHCERKDKKSSCHVEFVSIA